MKRRRRFATLILFGLCLAIGVWLGCRLGNYGLSLPPPTAIDSIPDLSRPDQRSLLVVGMDRLNSPEAKLQGVWYIIYRLNSPRITLIPIYPDPDATDPATEQELVESFRVRPNGEIDPDFFDFLGEKYRLDWDAKLFLDDIAMMEIVDFFGGVEVNGEKISGPRAIGGIMRPWEDPTSAILGQANLLVKLCQNVSYDTTPKTYDKVLSLIPEHLASEVTKDQAFSDWLGLLPIGSTLICEIPSLVPTPAP